jgi:hypothetical protein
MTRLTNAQTELSQALTLLIKAQTPSSGNSSGSNGNTGSNSSPSTNTSTSNGNSSPSTAPQSYLHAKAEREGKRVVEFPSVHMIASKS